MFIYQVAILNLFARDLCRLPNFLFLFWLVCCCPSVFFFFLCFPFSLVFHSHKLQTHSIFFPGRTQERVFTAKKMRYAPLFLFFFFRRRWKLAYIMYESRRRGSSTCIAEVRVQAPFLSELLLLPLKKRSKLSIRFRQAL